MKDLSKYFYLIFFLLSAEVFAFVPNPSQLGRFQAGLLNRSRSFSSSGNVEYQGNRMTYVLEWYGPESYQIRVSQISPSVYSQGQGANMWTLMRNKTQCIFKVGSQILNCPAPQAWPLLELSGIPEAGARGLFSAEIIESSELSFQETDSTLLSESTQGNRVQLVVSRDNKTPVAELELQGKNASVASNGEAHPLVRFNQTFLAPTLLRTKHNGEVFTIEAQSDLELKRGRTRFTWVLAHVLNVSSNLQQSLRIVRKEPALDAKLSPPKIEKSLSQIDSFKDTLSVAGLFLLDAILLTH